MKQKNNSLKLRNNNKLQQIHLSVKHIDKIAQIIILIRYVSVLMHLTCPLVNQTLLHYVSYYF